MLGCEITVKAENISFCFRSNNKKILNGINLELLKGEIVGIIGLSGSGKTTLMNVLNGIIPKRIEGNFEGTVILNGNDTSTLDIPKLSECIGTVYQNPDSQTVFSCVEDELAFGPENLCIEPDEIKKRIDEVLNFLNIERLRLSNPNNLSGGEKQLVVIASILVMNVDILIFDESMSWVDREGKKLIKEAILKLKNAGKSIIMVEHDMNNLDITDRVYKLENGTLSKVPDYK
jgi:energy-coupling factor transport system ATP-binding protein